MMELSRFEALARLYGGRIERWPPAEWESARRLVDSDERARAALRGAAQLDALLDDAALSVSPSDSARLTAATLERTRALGSRHRPRAAHWRHWWPAGLLAFAALAGCATARERPQWIGLADPAALINALAAAFDADGSRF
jgi:hypothetical protein